MLQDGSTGCISFQEVYHEPADVLDGYQCPMVSDANGCFLAIAILVASLQKDKILVRACPEGEF
jgi:hypothetical protein